MIILEKTREEKILSKNIIDINALAKVAQVSSFVDFAGRYNWAMSNNNLDAVKKIKQTDMKKY